MRLATSSGVPYRCMGMRCASTALAVSGCPGMKPVSSERIMRVSIGAGFTVLTRMFWAAPSSAAVRIKPTTACLLAQ